MTKKEKAAAAGFARVVFLEAQKYADKLDPKRRRANDASRAFDRMTEAANWAHWYLTGKHV